MVMNGFTVGLAIGMLHVRGADSVVTLQPRRKKLLPEAKEQQDDKKPLRTTQKVAHPAQSPIVQTKNTHCGKE